MSISKSKILVVGAAAFVAGVFFASSMDWTRIVGAQTKGRSSLVSNASLDDSQSAFVSVAERVTPAVVSVTAERTVKREELRARMQQVPPEFQKFFQDPGNGEPQPQQAQGSGFIVTKDGYILTNNHVVDGADNVKVSLLDHRTFKAKVVGHDIQTDVAVLKIDVSDLPTIPFGDDAKTRVGEWALAIGNPFGLDFTVTAGIISAKGRGGPALARLNASKYRIQDFIQTDAAINPGNSGGPLVNIRGEVVGINSAIASETGSYAGYGFAIPITLAKTVMDDIIAHGRVRRAIIGASIEEVSPEDAQVNKLKDLNGVKLLSVSEGGAAEKAGLEAGDIVLKIDGKPVEHLTMLQRLVRMHQPGDVIALEAVRYGDHKNFKVKLMEAVEDEKTVAEATKPLKDAPAVPTPTPAKRLGLVAEPLTAEIQKQDGVPTSVQGVNVKSVDRGGPAEQSKIFAGEIITGINYPEKIAIRNVEDFQKAVSKFKSGDVIGLTINYQADAAGNRATKVVNIRIGG